MDRDHNFITKKIILIYALFSKKLFVKINIIKNVFYSNSISTNSANSFWTIE